MADKQAVLIIHDIGEKWPMDTLRGFVDSVWQKDASVRERWQAETVWSKPNKFSNPSEVRRLTTTQNRDGLRTDFFDFCWMHLVGRPRIGHVATWLRLTMMRLPFGMPRSVVRFWYLMWLLVLPAGLLALHPLLPLSMRLSDLAWSIALAAGLLLAAAPHLLLFPILSKSIRYFGSAPVDIRRRRDIRDAGADLLRKMIDSGEYTRIVLIGHGMGSVIGYDILRTVWPDYNARAVGSRHMALDWLQQTIKNDPFDIDGYQEAQRDYCDELKANGSPWCVTDFLTIGSPLSRASMLFAPSPDTLAEKIAEREFPVTPPVEEVNGPNSRFTYERPLSGSKYVTRPIPHHGAVFAPVRWTNLYMPSRFFAFGDPDSTPLSAVFGEGVRDVAVETRKRSGFLTHHHYWTIENPKDPDNPGLAVRALRHHLQLAEGRQIVQVRDASSFETLVTDSPPVPNLTARVQAEIRKAVEAGAVKKEPSASEKLVMALQKPATDTETLEKPQANHEEIVDEVALEQAILEAPAEEPEIEPETDQKVAYFVYENPARDRVRIHAATCRYCQDVDTENEEDASENSARWHKAGSREEALKVADSLERKDTRTCGVCNP